MKVFLLLTLLAGLPAYSQTTLPKALVWGGPGACAQDCVTGAVTAAKKAGYNPVIVYPGSLVAEDFRDAKIWIQPGGKASQASFAMGSTIRNQIRTFVKNGGGYVGFCAGAFLATSTIGTTGNTGLGIVPGRTILYEAIDYITLERMKLLTPAGAVYRKIYWEGGPYFRFTAAELERIYVRGRYTRTNQIGAIRTTYGTGRVYVTGAHPEAPQWWRDSVNLVDSDGLDYGITTDMIKWAAKK